MSRSVHPLRKTTLQHIKRAFDRLDYSKLAAVYCEEGGEAFWEDRRGPCEALGISLAEVLRGRLKAGGCSLYVGAATAEIPLLFMETLELKRAVRAVNLRKPEVSLLNDACSPASFQFEHKAAASATGTYDHLWIVSVLNDPERFPELSSLSYGRANPVTFDATTFQVERQQVQKLTGECLRKLTRPALVTTTVEEIPWIVDWCEQKKVSYRVEEEDYPTAIVEDPVCFIQIKD